MKVRVISPRLVHVLCDIDEDGTRRLRRAKEGDEFEVKGIPSAWKGLVVPVDEEGRVVVTNPAQSERLKRLKEDYRERTGKAAHYTWDEAKLEEKLAELGEG